jgi:hypothetical protein
VELHPERRLLVRAECDGKPADPPLLGPCSLQDALAQVERWFASAQHRLFCISLHASDEHWQLATPRARTAVFFVISALERELLKASPGTT